MKRAKIYLYGLGVTAVILGLALLPMVQASADSNEGTILEFEGMVCVSGQFVGAMGTPIRGLHGGSLPWVIRSDEGCCRFRWERGT